MEGSASAKGKIRGSTPLTIFKFWKVRLMAMEVVRLVEELDLKSSTPEMVRGFDSLCLLYSLEFL